MAPNWLLTPPAVFFNFSVLSLQVIGSTFQLCFDFLILKFQIGLYFGQLTTQLIPFIAHFLQTAFQ